MHAFLTPPLSLGQAHLITAYFALSFVGSLYVSKNARLSFSTSPPAVDGALRPRPDDERDRDDPGVIKARLLAVTVSTVLSCVSVAGLLRYLSLDDLPWSEAIASTVYRLGIYPFRASVLSLLVAPVLYLGPIYACYLQQTLPLQSFWSIRNDLVPLFTSWISIRNYWVAPLTEEVVFRACVLAVYQLARPAAASRLPPIFLTPLSFGAAHAHHAWDAYNRLGRTRAAARRALLGTLFQLAYTSLFGFHCAFLFLRTGSLLPPLASHVWCNVMGVPQLGWELRRFPAHRSRIMAAYALGVAGYIYTMIYWTRTPGSIYWEGEGACGTCTGPKARGMPSWQSAPGS